jgi:hypothetical protein
LTTAEGVGLLERVICAYRPEVVFLDSVQKVFAGAQETTRGDWCGIRRAVSPAQKVQRYVHPAAPPEETAQRRAGPRRGYSLDSRKHRAHNPGFYDLGGDKGV